MHTTLSSKECFHLHVLASFVVVVMTFIIPCVESLNILPKTSLSSSSDEPYCCLPKVCSMTCSYSFIPLSSGGSTSISMTTTKEYYDFGSNRKRSEEFMNMNSSQKKNGISNELTLSSISLLVKDAYYDYTYFLGNSSNSRECHCQRSPNVRKLIQCFGIPDGNIEKARLLNLDATKLSFGVLQHGFYFEDWVVQNETNSSDSSQCWHLSRTLVDPNSVQRFDYYDMSEKVDSKLFEIPPWCPTKDNCQIVN
ncbi:hypothetical protein C9374_000070 [Naegleria lovaniensis]|uniref:Uncharacterized protein n=1 Tax=Naegleria lovaniensis TaxID=51637 RepID=A0AA88KPH7_NAELO|nr:uncharacterized protein C9374_000070 [Naegleria lovaniensis]KAG2388631.1 hypothetical protein C9374_000070 [Naegleria lovaniensis]